MCLLGLEIFHWALHKICRVFLGQFRKQRDFIDVKVGGNNRNRCFSDTCDHAKKQAPEGLESAIVFAVGGEGNAGGRGAHTPQSAAGAFCGHR